MAGGVSKTENVEAMLQQLIENFADRQPAPRDSGVARERHVQKSQLSDDTALWENMAPKKHWVLRGRIPPNIGDSAADIQSFVGEAANVTTAVATQLHAISDFDVHAYGPRAEGMVDHLVMVADRLDFLRQALCGDPVCWVFPRQRRRPPLPERVATIDADFTSASVDLRRHTLSNIILLSGSAAWAVMREMITDDLRLWVNDLMRFAQQVRPPMVPPPFDFTFSMPPVPSFNRTSAFCSSGGGVLKLVEGLHVPRESQDGPSKRKSNPANPGTPRKIIAAQCRQFDSLGRCRFSNCKFLHSAPPADATSPDALRDSGSSAAPAGGSRALVLRSESRGGSGGGSGAGSG